MKLKQISFLSFFATVLVVIGHSDITLDYKDLWLYKWVYSFHMPLFFFISGFLFAYTNPESKIGGALKYQLFYIKKFGDCYIRISYLIQLYLFSNHY